jgi:hypothetical protein
MIKDRIIDILKTLTELTSSSKISWIEMDPKSSERDHRRKMTTKTEDGTKYEIEIKYVFDKSTENWNLDSDPSLWIRNINLPGGMWLVSTYQYPKELKELITIIKDNFCSDMSPTTKDVEDVFLQILKGISKEEWRESTINKILNNVSN